MISNLYPISNIGINLPLNLEIEERAKEGLVVDEIRAQSPRPQLGILTTKLQPQCFTKNNIFVIKKSKLKILIVYLE